MVEEDALETVNDLADFVSEVGFAGFSLFQKITAAIPPNVTATSATLKMPVWIGPHPKTMKSVTSP